jgi:hypothetical protein
MKFALALLSLVLSTAALGEPIKGPPGDAGFAISLSMPDLRPKPGIGVYEVDLFDTPESTIEALQAARGYVICYFSAGSVEDWRPDTADFPASVIGKDYAGWPGERWLDIRRRDVLAPILDARLDLAVEKGCNAVDPDNVDGFSNDTGFDISAGDQRNFNLWLAATAHQRGLGIGLKNTAELIPDLVASFDFAVVESCAAEGACAAFLPFSAHKKAVFQIEYVDAIRDWASVCRDATKRGFTAILASLDLDGTAEGCPRP